MGNVISSFASGFGKVLGDLFGSPLDFLAGKSCSSVCGSTWDFLCYIENFCVTNLLKMAMVLVLSYIVLLFLYLLYKMGICECVIHSLCKMIWACLVCWFSLWENTCIFLCHKLINLKRVNRRRRHHHHRHGRHFTDMDSIEERHYIDSDDAMEGSGGGSRSRRMRHDYKRKVHLNKSLKPRSHRVRVKVRRDWEDHGSRRTSSDISDKVDSIRVTHTSRFVRKGTDLRGKAYSRGRRWRG